MELLPGFNSLVLSYFSLPKVDKLQHTRPHLTSKSYGDQSTSELLERFVTMEDVAESVV